MRAGLSRILSFGKWSGLALLALLALAGCNTTQTVVPNAVVLINPTPGLPSVYNGQVVAAPGGPFPGPCCQPSPPCCDGTTTPPATCQTHYTVQCGDTLSGIAKQYGVSVQAIAAANSISNPNLIVAGDDLCIPPAGGPTPRVVTPTPTRTPNPSRTPTLTRTPTPTRTLRVIPTVGANNLSPSVAAEVADLRDDCKRTCTLNPTAIACYIAQPNDTLAKVATLCSTPNRRLFPGNIIAMNRADMDSLRVLKPGQEIIIIPKVVTPGPGG